MLSYLKRLNSAFRAAQDGHVAVIFALAAVPLLVVTTTALDMHQLDRVETSMAAALDNAALAAVANQSITEDERAVLAKQVFWENVTNNPERISLEVVSSDPARVELSATAIVPTSLLAITGRQTFEAQSESAATVTRGGVVCMMTLDPSSAGSFEVTSGATLNADTCAVQVNSTHSSAAIVNHGGRAKAADFCIAGGASGPFEPFVNSECGVITDPYLNRQAPDTGDCVDGTELLDLLATWQAESSGVTLKPGTYCGGLTLRGKNVTFEPGVYTIKDGPIFFDYGTQAKAEGVTFVLQGQNAFLDVHEGSSVSISAPKSGPTAGLAFFQDVHTDSKNFPSLPSGRSTIRSGGKVEIIGTVYLPHQVVSFKGGSLLQSQAPATSFIGYRIHISDAAKIGVAVDHRSAGLPPIEPRHDESVRLER
jgi:Flp pilus assembly protein TadG